jgi:hypothetical protein
MKFKLILYNIQKGGNMPLAIFALSVLVCAFAGCVIMAIILKGKDYFIFSGLSVVFLIFIVIAIVKLSAPAYAKTENVSSANYNSGIVFDPNQPHQLLALCKTIGNDARDTTAVKLLIYVYGDLSAGKYQEPNYYAVFPRLGSRLVKYSSRSIEEAKECAHEGTSRITAIVITVLDTSELSKADWEKAKTILW